jgi:hypothetical protein
MSTFWTIFWFVINLILGAILAIACASVGKWCKRLVNAETSWGKGEAESKISGWLWALVATLIIIFTIAFGRVGFGFAKELDKVNDRIEALEQQTVTPAIDTLFIKDVLKDE